MKTTCKQIGMILLVSGFLAVIANTVHPRKIPWLQDWAVHVEAQAREQNINAVPFSVALARYEAGESVFIDARSADEYARGHVPGALSIPFASFDEHFEAVVELIDSGKELVLYCRNRACDDALLLAVELQSIGAGQVVLYVDGFEAWAEHGGEVEP